MTTKWDQYKATESSDKWGKYIEKQKAPEGFLKSTARTALQVPKGMAQVTGYGLGTNLWNLLGSAEALSELQKFENFREEELRQKFPTAPWPEQKAFDKGKYLEALSQASKTIPTVSNVSSFIESQTGLPLEARTKLQKLVELGSGFLKKPVSGVIPSKANKDLYNFGKAMGMTEEQITPLMQSERKIKWLSNLAQKGKRANKALESTHEALGEAYKSILDSPEAQNMLTPTQALKFANKVKALTATMPYDVKVALRNDALELAQNGFKGSELMNLWKDVGHQYARGNKELAILKGPIGEALTDISPELGNKFSKINNLYSKYYNIIKAMKPGIYTELEKQGKPLYLLKNLLFFNPRALASLGVYQGAKSLAREALINPKFQSLTKKLISSLNNYKYGTANLVLDRMNEIIKKDSPEIAEELENINFNELKKS